MWPVAARAAAREKVRRIGVLMPLAADDPESHARLAAFAQGLQQLGWTIGRNVRIETRWGSADTDVTRKYAAELAALEPDVILANGSAAVAPLLHATRAVAIVFAIVPDPVGAGFVKSLARPGGNATGFLLFESAISTKWLEPLKEVAPGITRVGVILDPTTSAGIAQWTAIQAAAPSAGVEVDPIDGGAVRETERAVGAFASPYRGLVLTSGAWAIVNRDLVVALAARHRLPAVYFGRHFATSGGLISYGPDFIDQYRQAAGYVDRILKGEKPADLPVQAPTKYELVINLKTARALGLEIPPTLLARADEVIE